MRYSLATSRNTGRGPAGLPREGPQAVRRESRLTAYTCGDALGVPWENAPVGGTPSQIEQLPVRQGWPRGATSDDTALTLLVAHHLADRDGDGDPAAWLMRARFRAGAGGSGMSGVACGGVDRSSADRSFAAAMRSPMSGGSVLMKRLAMVFAIDV